MFWTGLQASCGFVGVTPSLRMTSTMAKRAVTEAARGALALALVLPALMTTAAVLQASVVKVKIWGKTTGKEKAEVLIP